MSQNKLILSLYYLTFLTTFINSQNDDDKTIVEIKTGKIQGLKEKLFQSKNYYYSFRSIPYAQPPVNALRFKPPRESGKWKGILNATSDPPLCLQYNSKIMGQEDCLYLSVYTPNPKPNSKLFPVMVYLFGGGFLYGNISKATYGPDMFMSENVVVVLLNYRLSIFGFLSTGDEYAPGNMALRDQNMALKWINKNIGAFGGDKNRVTIFGHSAGAVSVDLHLQSALSKGLFRAAIMMSASSLCSWSYARNSKEIAFSVGSQAGIKTNSSQELVEKMRKVNATDLVKATNSAILKYALLNDLDQGLPFGPVIESPGRNAFISTPFHSKLSSRKFNVVPVILGVTSNEGEGDVIKPLRIYVTLYGWNDATLTPNDLNLNGTEKEELGKIIRKEYFKNDLIITPNSKDTTQWGTDNLFFRPMTESARLMYAATKNTYLYKFTYKTPIQNGFKQPGVRHGDDLELYWIKEGRKNYSKQDLMVMRRQVKMWTNFAKFYKPMTSKDQTLFGNFSWNVVGNKSPNLNYLEMGAKLKMNSMLSPKMPFWFEVYRNYSLPDFTTF